MNLKFKILWVVLAVSSSLSPALAAGLSCEALPDTLDQVVSATAEMSDAGVHNTPSWCQPAQNQLDAVSMALKIIAHDPKHCGASPKEIGSLKKTVSVTKFQRPIMCMDKH